MMAQRAHGYQSDFEVLQMCATLLLIEHFSDVQFQENQQYVGEKNQDPAGEHTATEPKKKGGGSLEVIH